MMLDFALKNKYKLLNVARKYSNDPENVFNEFCLKAALDKKKKDIECEDKYYMRSFVNFCINYTRTERVTCLSVEDLIDNNLKDVVLYSHHEKNNSLPVSFNEKIESRKTLEKFVFFAKPYLTKKEVFVLEKIVETILNGENVEFISLAAKELNEPHNRIKILFHFIRTKLKNKKRLKKLLQN